mgnify:CR=1 FL=1
MSSTQPNMVLFFTDQLRADALGCYGNQICMTPNIDRLAGDGVIFNNAYTTSPVCSASRSSLMTGLYPHNHGVMLNTHIAPAWSRGLDRQVPVFSNILKNSGFNVGLAGNIGYSFSRSVSENQFDYYVLEVSSFQLDHILNFRPDISVITNITPDHLDRYCLLYTSPSPRDRQKSRMPSSA